ncbi:MAG: hypothetical protein AAGC60_22415 [Acidobacteriota bacterium]
MKRIGLVLALIGLLCLGGQSIAEQCTIDAVPAATLLLPYFEVDYSNPNGLTTLFSVNNASAAPAVAHVTLWTDYSVPTIDFDIFLTGFDVATVNLRDVFNDGVLPRTADDSQDPDDTISPSPAGLGWDGDIPNCNGILPFTNPAVGAALLERIQNGHTGNPSAFDGGACLGFNYGDNIARGYITIDNVNNCNLLFPTSAGYFADAGAGTASNQNQLWGDYFYVDVANAFAQGEPLVHIEAFDGVGTGGAWSAGDYTFYGRYVGGTAVDNREPLTSVFGTRYLTGAGFSGGTDLIVWRDSKSPDASGVSCASDPSWFPLAQSEVVAFDEEENPTVLCFDDGDISPPLDARTCFPLETQRVPVGQVWAAGDPVDPPAENGWLFLNLNHTLGVGSPFPGIAQNWVTATMSASGLYSVGLEAISLVSACDGLNPLIFPGGP